MERREYEALVFALAQGDVSTVPKSFWLAQLEWLASLGADMPNSRRLGIVRARAAGATDAEIATALGISRQAVAKAVPR